MAVGVNCLYVTILQRVYKLIAYLLCTMYMYAKGTVKWDLVALGLPMTIVSNKLLIFFFFNENF